MQLTYADFAVSVFGYYDGQKFNVINTATGNIIHSQEHKPYTTIEGADAFFRALYKVKFSN